MAASPTAVAPWGHPQHPNTAAALKAWYEQRRAQKAAGEISQIYPPRPGTPAWEEECEAQWERYRQETLRQQEIDRAKQERWREIYPGYGR